MERVLAKGEGESGAKRPEERGLTPAVPARKPDCPLLSDCCVVLSSGGMRRGDAEEGVRVAESGVRDCMPLRGGMKEANAAGADTAAVRAAVADKYVAAEEYGAPAPADGNC